MLSPRKHCIGVRRFAVASHQEAQKVLSCLERRKDRTVRKEGEGGVIGKVTYSTAGGGGQSQNLLPFIEVSIPSPQEPAM